MNENRFVTIALIIATMSSASLAQAGNSGTAWEPGSRGDYSIGPSVAWVAGDLDGLAVNIDASYSYSYFSASLNLKYLGAELEASAATPRVHLFGPQVEFTAYFVLNVGVGAGYLFGEDEGGLNINLFVGLPLLSDFAFGWARWLAKLPFFVEPYLRINWLGDVETHYTELGLFIKWTTFR